MLIPIILSGGAGTRLWPSSRQAHPKPFMRLGGRTLLQQAIERGQACGASEALIVTNQDYVHLTKNMVQSDMAAAPDLTYLLEPTGRNTAPAIALAALACAQTYGGDAVMLVLPADHLITDTESFVANVLEASRQAQQGFLVTFGIVPTAPETGFGYIEVERVGRHTQKALMFVEKPDAATAQEYLATGRYYWNSGMFCFTAQAILAAFALHSPEVLAAAEQTFAQRQTNANETKFDEASFVRQPDISIDYAVMERADNVVLVPAKFGWSDVGTWSAVSNAHTADSNGNTFLGDVVSIDTVDTHVQVESHAHKIVATIGLSDLVIVDTPDALLVAHKDVSQKVKNIVELLKSHQHETTNLPATVHRPWGTYASLKEETGYKVKRITVMPGQSLSLQYHHQRAEHWVVVQGIANVQIGAIEHVTNAGEYRYIALGETHRLTNIGTDELVMIEVQCGTYLGEDDIVRLADRYGRE